MGAAASELRVVQRDLKLMESSPHSWCVDRCLATGHCDAAEDMLQLTTTEVIAFCEACGAEECELPEAADPQRARAVAVAKAADGGSGSLG